METNCAIMSSMWKDRAGLRYQVRSPCFLNCNDIVFFLPPSCLNASLQPSFAVGYPFAMPTHKRLDVKSCPKT